MSVRIFRLLPCVLLAAGLSAQTDRVPRIDDSRRVVLSGHVRRQARTENDQGAIDGAFAVPGMTILLQPSTAQKAALQQLLADQQDPSSPRYHRWLTPEEYADAYGVTAADISRISDWLKSQGFSVTNVARSRTFLSFTGTAEQAQNAFHTPLHRYLVNGRLHYANATAPSIPAALAGVVSSVRGLNDFHLKAHLKLPSQPDMNSGSSHHLAPDDIASIYDIAPLLQNGVDGTGQSIAIVGQSRIQTADIQRFRSQFNLSTPNLTTQLVPGRPDPGIVDTDMQESDLDIEWAGAVARNARIVFVYSDDVVESAIYAIDQNLAQVLSMSYGGCEQADLIDLPGFQALAQQANAQGMTWLASSGDSGAGACEDPGATIAQDGLSVSSPASVPEITALGGTTLADQGGSYWAPSNSANSASALGYIPETAWNDTPLGFGLAAGGGGASVFFPQPVWQNGPGVPNDGMRHIPDLAFASSPAHVSYYFYSGGSSGYVGGTSAAAPVMAGIVALLNHYLVSTGAQKQPGVGNINPALYRLAQSTTGIFHDVTTGSNIVPCVAGSPNCTGGTFGLSAAAGYDQVTGLGSLDATNFVHGWTGRPPLNAAVVMSLDQNPVFQQKPDSSGNPWHFTLTLTEEAGIATRVTGLTIDGADLTARLASLFGNTSIAANGSISANIGLSNLAVPKTVVFVVTGVDAGGAAWTQQLSIPFAGPQVALGIAGVGNAASGQTVFAPGMILSVYGTALGTFTQSFGAVPLPLYLAGFEASVNGVPAPLYYVSANQVNLQIPYETQPGLATLTIGNPYADMNYRFQVAAAAPGIFTNTDGTLVPFATASRGSTITLYLTGDGQLTPSLATGTAPAATTPVSRLPKPRLPVTVTVGGSAATTTFVGIPPGYVGVTQINFTVPADAPTGLQNVVVTVGTASSAPARLTVQ